MRFRSIANWVLLCLNCVFFVLLLVFSLVYEHDGAIDPEAMRAAERGLAVYEEGDILRDVYCAKGPFALWVAKDFPSDQAFDFFQYALGLSLSLDSPLPPDEDDGETHSLALELGDDFWFTVNFCPAGRYPEVRSFALYQTRGDVLVTLRDNNADGVFDMRQTMDEVKGVSRTNVWYHGTWRAVAPRSSEEFQQTEYRRQLVDGERVYFNLQTGEWLPLTKDAVPSAKRKAP